MGATDGAGIIVSDDTDGEDNSSPKEPDNDIDSTESSEDN